MTVGNDASSFGAGGALEADLFGSVSLPGLAYAENIISEAEERALIARICDARLTPFRFQQWEGKRLTRSFGWTYDFETNRFAPGDPIPRWIEPIRARAARFAGLEVDALAQLLLIEYGVGAGIGWHRDRPVFDHVVGISLGARAVMRFRRRKGTRFERAKAALAPRSAYHLSGEVRNARAHSIAAMDEPRWSITFRSLS